MESTTLWRYIRLHREQEQLTWVKAIKIRIPHLRVQLNSIRAARKLFTSCVRTLRGGDDCGEQGANEEAGRRCWGWGWGWLAAYGSRVGVHSMWEDGNVLMKNRNVL